MATKPPKPRVLLVDDYPDARDMYAEYLEFSGFDRIEGLRFPAEATLSAEAPRVRMRLVWQDVEQNPALDRKIFSPGIPAGVRILDLEGAAPPALLAPAPPPAAE